ncbi:hypothetical protein J6590_001823 [Homalodisca vitripennis]|nr:hypothetical protein J6590_001823 [Homalodisca vitripennis]
MDPAVPGTSGQTNFHSSNEQKYDSDGSVDFIQRVDDDSSSDNSSACYESDDEATVIEVPTWSITTTGQKRMRKEAHKLDKIKGQEANVSRTKRKKCRQCTKNGKPNVKTAFHCVTCPEKPGLCMVRDQCNMRPAPGGAETCDVTVPGNSAGNVI